MIDCIHYFGHLLPFGVSDPGFVSPCSHSDTLEAISWLFQLMSGGLVPDDAAEWCKIPLQGFLSPPSRHCPWKWPPWLVVRASRGCGWKLLSVTALPLCSPHLLLLLRGLLLCFETLEGKDISSCHWRPSLQFVLSLGRIMCHSSLPLCLFLHRRQVVCPHFPSADFPPTCQEAEATESQSTVSSCLNSDKSRKKKHL